MIISKRHKKYLNQTSKRVSISKIAAGEGAVVRTVGRAALSGTGDEGSVYPLPGGVNLETMSPEAKEWWDVLVEFNTHEEKATAAAFQSGLEGLKGFCEDMDGKVGEDGAQEILDEAQSDPEALPALEAQYNEDPSVFDTIEENRECIDESTASLKDIRKIKKRSISKNHDTYYANNHDLIAATYRITESKMKRKGFDKKDLSLDIKKIASNKKHLSNYSESYFLESLKAYLELDYIKKYGSKGRSALKRDLDEFVSVIGSGEKTFDELFKTSQSYNGKINKNAFNDKENILLMKKAGSHYNGLKKEAILGWLEEQYDSAVETVDDLGSAAWDGITDAAGAIAGVAEDVYDVTTEGLSIAWEGISTAGCKLWEWMKDAGAATWAFLSGAVIGIISAIMKFGAKLLPFLGLLFSVGAIIDGVYYGYRALKDDIMPLASEAGFGLGGMKVFKFNETAEEAGRAFEESSTDAARQKILAKYTKGLRDFQHNFYQVILNTVQALLDTVFIVLELAGLLTAGAVTAVAVCLDIFTSMVIMGIETGIKERIANAYKTTLDTAFANAQVEWSNAMRRSAGQAGDEVEPARYLSLEEREEMARQSEQEDSSDSGNSLMSMLDSSLPPAQQNNVVPLPIAQQPAQQSGPGAMLEPRSIAASVKVNRPKAITKVSAYR